jgi:uncharacterized membrane protein YqjE
MNLIAIIVAALTPMATGFIWYNPKVFGYIWMEVSGTTEEKIKGANMAVIFGLTFVFSLLFAFGTSQLVIHQNHFYSLLINEPGFGEEGSEVQAMITSFMESYGSNFRTFKHGLFHGLLSGIFLVLPIVAVNALFERKSWKYIWINSGFWIVNMMIMGAIICGWT